MYLSKKMIYKILNFDDPIIFRDNQIINNLFNIDQNFREADIYRRIGKTTSLIIDSIHAILQGDKTVVVYCSDFQHVRFFLNELKNILVKINQHHPIKFKEKASDCHIFFEDLRSHIFVKSDLSQLWSGVKYDLAYRDI